MIIGLKNFGRIVEKEVTTYLTGVRSENYVGIETFSLLGTMAGGI